jgi:hypothetical protein
MRKTIAFILLFSAYSMAINPFTYKWTIRLTGDTATVVKWKANNDSVLNWATRISDTVTNKVPRWLSILRGDSTFHRINADTISSNPVVDSISGHPVIDSLKLGNSVNYLSEYIDTTFYDSLFDNTTYRTRALARIVKIGSLITIYQPQMIDNISSGTAFIKGVPSKFMPIGIYVYVPVENGGTYTTRVIYDNSSVLKMDFTNGTAGIRNCSFSWIK